MAHYHQAASCKQGLSVERDYSLFCVCFFARVSLWFLMYSIHGRCMHDSRKNVLRKAILAGVRTERRDSCSTVRRLSLCSISPGREEDGVGGRESEGKRSRLVHPTALPLQVVRSLRQLEKESFGNGAMVEVRDLDYNLLSWEDQIKNDLETDIMVRPCLPWCTGIFLVVF